MVVLAVSESEGVNAWAGLVTGGVISRSQITIHNSSAWMVAAAGHPPNYNQLSSRIVALLIIYTRPDISTPRYIYTHGQRYLHTHL